MNIEKIITFDKGEMKVPVQGSKKLIKRSVQGMTIRDGKLFQLYHSGMCNVFDLASGNPDPIATFPLGSMSEHNHANNCNFSHRHLNGNPMPLLYVVDGNSGEVIRCSVENITEENGTYSSEKVQELNLDQSGFEKAGYMPYWGWPSWLVDGKSDFIWIIGARYRTNGSMQEFYNENRYIITKFKLPPTEAGDVVLTADDVVDQFITEYNVNFMQGGTISGKYLFYTFGTGREDNPSSIRVWDLEARRLHASLDVSEVAEELEDCSVVGDRLLFITQKSSLYGISLADATAR